MESVYRIEREVFHRAVMKKRENNQHRLDVLSQEQFTSNSTTLAQLKTYKAMNWLQRIIFNFRHQETVLDRIFKLEEIIDRLNEHTAWEKKNCRDLIEECNDKLAQLNLSSTKFTQITYGEIQRYGLQDEMAHVFSGK